jgi:hypothetical protein
MFEAHPDLEPLLTAFQGRNQRYVAHELLNSHWRSKMFRVVAAAMASIKCEYIGSAMLVSNIPNLTVPPGCREMFGQARRIDLRETLRDLMAGISFRRDLYQRGPRPAGQLERSRKVDAIALVRTFRPVPDTITIDSALGQITPDQQCFRAMLRVLDAGPTTVGQLRRDPALTRWSDAELQEVAILLISGDYVAPMLTTAPDPAAIAAAARLNRVHTALFEQGQDRPYLVLPALGAAWQVSHLEMLILDELRAGRAEEEAPLFNAVRDRVTRTGRQLLRDGHPVTDPAAAREMVAGAIRDTLRRTAMMRLLGVLDQPARPPAGQALAT